jgi:hypothetical protein
MRTRSAASARPFLAYALWCALACALALAITPAHAQCLSPLQRFEFTPSPNFTLGQFGASVAVDGVGAGVTVAIGAPGERVTLPGLPEADAAGRVHVWDRDGLGYSREQVLIAFPVIELAKFGSSVAILGDTMLVGAPGEPNGPGFENAEAGAAYLFRRTNGVWALQERFVAPVRQGGDDFGWSVALSSIGTRILAFVGAPGDVQVFPNGSAGVPDSGAVFVYSFNLIAPGAGWTFVERVVPTGVGADRFGESVAASGTTLAVGAPRDDVTAFTDAGSVTTFGGGLTGSSWTQLATVTAANPVALERFGVSVALEGSTMVVGVAQRNAGGPNAGALDFFALSSTWQRVSTFSGDSGSFLGVEVSLSGDFAVAACRREDGNQRPVRLYRRTGDVWTFSGTVLPLPEAGWLRGQGSGVAVHEGVVVVGSQGAVVDTLGDAGLAHAFDLVPATSVSFPEELPSVEACAGATVQVIAAATGTGPLSYSWQRRLPNGAWTPLNGGTVGGLGVVSGTTTATLTVTNLAPGAATTVRCVATNWCGSVASPSATITALSATDPACAACPPCPADFDQDGGVTGADIEAFFAAFESGDACGDTDQDGGVTGADIEVFFASFQAGGC